MPDPDGPDPDGRDDAARPRLTRRVLAVVVVLGVALMWLYIFTVDQERPDELDDTAWGEQAEAICAETAEALEALPPARDAESPAERGAVVMQANEELVAQLQALRSVPAASAADQELVDAWLADWETYLADRAAYAEALLDGEEAELLITARGGRQITLTLDRFADLNGAPSCQSPRDA